MGLCCLIFACPNLCACLCGCGAEFFDLQFPTMKFQSLRNISVVFAAALVLLSLRAWADADVSGGGALFEKLPVYWSPKNRPLTGNVDLKSVDGFEWRIYHRSPILIHPMAGPAIDKD